MADVKQVAVIVALTLVAATAATWVVRHSHGHDAGIEQAGAQRAGLVPHPERGLEQMLVHAPDRNVAASAGKTRGSAPSLYPLRDDASTRDSVSKEIVSQASPDDERAERDAAIQAGNGIIDRAIQNGQWRSIDFALFNAATYMLSSEEQADMLARMSGAITRGEVRFEPR